MPNLSSTQPSLMEEGKDLLRVGSSFDSMPLGGRWGMDESNTVYMYALS